MAAEDASEEGNVKGEVTVSIKPVAETHIFHPTSSVGDDKSSRERDRRTTEVSVAYSTISRVSVPNTITKDKVPRHFMQIGNVDTKKSMCYKAIQELQVRTSHDCIDLHVHKS